MRDEQYKAYALCRAAIRSGDLVRAAECERCGAPSKGMHGHHADYSKPLDVEWLCRPCHTKEHSGTPYQRRDGGETIGGFLRRLEHDLLQDAPT